MPAKCGTGRCCESTLESGFDVGFWIFGGLFVEFVERKSIYVWNGALRDGRERKAKEKGILVWSKKKTKVVQQNEMKIVVQDNTKPICFG